MMEYLHIFFLYFYVDIYTIYICIPTYIKMNTHVYHSERDIERGFIKYIVLLDYGS